MAMIFHGSYRPLEAQGGTAAMAGTTVWCRLSAVNGQWHAKEVGHI